MDDLLAAMGGAGPVRPPPAPPSRSAASMEEEDAAAEHCTTEMECIVCLDARRGSVLVPCGHTNMCMPCAQELIGAPLACGETPLCPECRREVLHVFQAHL